MTATKYSAVILGITWQQEQCSLPSMIYVFISSDLLYQILISIIAYMRHQNFWDVKWVMASFGFSSGRPPSRVFCWSVQNTRGFRSVSQVQALQAINSLQRPGGGPHPPLLTPCFSKGHWQQQSCCFCHVGGRVLTLISRVSSTAFRQLACHFSDVSFDINRLPFLSFVNRIFQTWRGSCRSMILLSPSFSALLLISPCSRCMTSGMPQGLSLVVGCPFTGVSQSPDD